jgi:hypothetical protein
MTLQETLATRDVVQVFYTKADGSTACYNLTHTLAPTFKAKTDRARREAPYMSDHLLTAYDITGQRFISLKLENITFWAWRLTENMR